MVQEFGSAARLAESDVAHALPEGLGSGSDSASAQTDNKDVWCALG